MNKLAGIMDSDRNIHHVITKDEIHRNWKIDLENKNISYKNYNIYQPIYEFVSRYQFTYFLNYDTDAFTMSKVLTLINYMNRIFLYCERIENWAIKEKKQIRFVSNAPHFPHAAAYRIFCEVRGYKNNMNFLVLSPGYDNYFKNVGDAKTETISILNMTKNDKVRNSFLGTKEGFDEYFAMHKKKLDIYKKQALKWLEYNRSDKDINTEKKQNVINTIKKYKKDRKKIYLLNGKVVFDLCVKYTKGCAHEDMSDWITDTVSIINKNEDILLLIKPHPHEERRDLTMTSEPVITLKDLIKVEMKDNVIYLENSMFKIGELIEYIDLGILWNGTSSLELAAQGIKTIVCDEWGHMDYPIGFMKLESRAAYANFLNNYIPHEEEVEIQEKAIMFLHYMGSDSVRFKNIYTETSTLNYFQFTNSRIRGERIDEYLENGDKLLENFFLSVDD